MNANLGMFVDLYRKMLLIRSLENRLQSYCDQGLAGDLHFNKGQEAIAVGVCSELNKHDYIVTHHRTIAHQIARGAQLGPLVAELLGKKTGVNKGAAGEMHISDASIRHAFAFQLVGTCIPVAAGLAWALKNHHQTKDVVAVFFGDAASGNGQFHEGLNLAAVHELPLLMICENNKLAGNITQNFYLPYEQTVSGRAKGGYGIESCVVDGNDLGEVKEATRKALAFIRTMNRPYMIECLTERLCWHKQGQRDIRGAAEIETLAEREPLRRLTKTLAPLVDFEVMQKDIEADLDLAFQFAETSPLPSF